MKNMVAGCKVSIMIAAKVVIKKVQRFFSFLYMSQRNVIFSFLITILPA